MIRRLGRGAAHGAWLASLLPRWRSFEAALSHPEATQTALLRRFLAANARTVYGRRHGYARIRSLAELQDRVPVVDHSDLAPYLARMAAGEPNVLCPGRVNLFERSSGSAAAAKLIPYPAALRAEFSAALAPWLGSLHARWPGLIGGPAYWSLSPVVRQAERTPGGARLGLEDDAEYLGPVARRVATALLAVPGRVAHAPDLSTWRRETLRHLLAAEDLRLLSVWSPSFLTELMRHLAADWDALLAALPRARRRALTRASHGGAILGHRIWPRLAALSCWTDAAAAAAVPALRRSFPQTPLQPKGLLATEGVITLPWLPAHTPKLARRPTEDPALGPLIPGLRPMAITAHVLELAPADDPGARPLAPHQAELGGRYLPLLTTAGGLARYRLGDEVVCTGFAHATPCLAFAGKRDAVSDLCGEKLHPAHAQRALDAAAARTGLRPEYACLVGHPGDPAGYWLVLTPPAGAGRDRPTQAARCAAYCAAVEAGLRDNPQYAYARDLGQLAPLALRPCAAGAGWYLAARQAQGQRLGDIKPTPLAPPGTPLPPLEPPRD